MPPHAVCAERYSIASSDDMTDYGAEVRKLTS